MDIIAQYIPKLFIPVVADTAKACGFGITYEWGHKTEVDGLLKTKDQKAKKKFPLIWMVMDFDETKGKNPDIYSEVSLSFVFVVNTMPEYTERQRQSNTFEPILLPMYAQFLNAIGRSVSFRRPIATTIKHKMRLRPYWGDGATNLFADYCDCIEVVNLALDVRRANCILP